MRYQDFLSEKLIRDPETGFEVEQLSDALYPFQAQIVRWTLKRGRAAMFADCGLGKTPDGRRFVGIELKRSYFETACRNLEEAGGQMRLVA